MDYFVVHVFSQLVNTGVLTTRDVGSWWLSIPGAGVFMKNFSNGKITYNLSFLYNSLKKSKLLNWNTQDLLVLFLEYRP